MSDPYGYIKRFPSDTIKAFNEAFRKAPDKLSARKLPAGPYVGFLDTAMLTESQKTPGQIGVFLRVTVIEPKEYRGWHAIRFYTIDPSSPQTAMNFLRPVLKVLGFRWDDVESLDDPMRFSEILNKKVDFDISYPKNNPDFGRMEITKAYNKMTEQQMQYFGTKEG